MLKEETDHLGEASQYHLYHLDLNHKPTKPQATANSKLDKLEDRDKAEVLTSTGVIQSIQS